jgi:hypothetical protein
MEGVYSSSQPLIDCGFINNDQFWVLTSVNTIEICNIENADLYKLIDKFPHHVDYVITCI